MRQQERIEKENLIWRRLLGETPTDTHSLFNRQETVTLLCIKNGMSGIIGNGFYSHQEATEIINQIQSFYSNVTPEELAFLNADTYMCPHCGELLTIDEFYRITSSPNHMGLKIIGSFNDLALSCVCKECTYLAPIQLSSEKDRKGFAYLAYWAAEQVYKLGASKTPDKRMTELNQEYRGIQLLHEIPAADMWVAESQLLSRFLHRHVTNELFDLTSEDVKFILSLGANHD